MERDIEKQSNAVLYIITSGIFLFLMTLCVKTLKDLPVSQVVFFRAIISFVICYYLLKRRGISPWGEKNKKLLLLRGAFGTSALILFFATVQKLPLATAVTIHHLTPIIATLSAMFLLKEKVYKLQWLFFLLSFAGIVFIKGFETDSSGLYIMMGVCTAFLAAGAYTTISKIGHSEHPLVIIFYFPLITLPIITPITLYQWVQPTLIQWFLLLLLGIFVQLGQYFLTLAYRQGNLGSITIFNYLSAIYALVAGYFLFEEVLPPRTLTGIAMILGGVIFNTLYSTHKKKIRAIV